MQKNNDIKVEICRWLNDAPFAYSMTYDEGTIDTLQAGKADVKEVQQGADCGLGFTGKTKIEVGDLLEVYTEEMKERTLNVEGAN